jgi:hypothetical protein
MRACSMILGSFLLAIPVLVSADAPEGVSPPAEADLRAQRVARAEDAIAELQSTLLARLQEAMAAGGPAAAVTVCRDEAQALTAAVGEKHRLLIGRTSERVRNPANVPKPWAAAHVAASAGLKLAEATPRVIDLADRGIGVLRPIGVAPLCVACHGAPESVRAVIGPVLADAYPDDRAVGYAPGDLRGWFWVEVR